MAIIREERIGGQRLILGDNREIWGGNYFDLLPTSLASTVEYDFC